MSRQMHLIAFLSNGPVSHHYGGWRHPGADRRFMTSEFWEEMARTAEEARFDAVFFADANTLFDMPSLAKGGLVHLIDPVPLAANVLRATTKIGVGITVSTSVYEPYGIARSLGTLDYLSGGRLAWNVVTSVFDKEARRFGIDGLLDRNARYDRAAEVVEACFQLWDSFPADAMIFDKNTGEYMDPSKLKTFEYLGKYVRTEGPLNAPASPQGRPRIMQAGASEKGRDFAARYGEMLFTIDDTAEGMRRFYDDMKRRVVAAGRAPEDCKIFPLVEVVVAETEEMAHERRAYVDALLDDDVAIAWASDSTGVDLRQFPLDERLGNIEDAGQVGSVGYLQRLRNLEATHGRELTLREAARLFCLAGGAALTGTPTQVADQLQDLFEQNAADGFMIGSPVFPGSFDDFARMVVPILQQRGLFRLEYPGTTLRDTLKN